MTRKNAQGITWRQICISKNASVRSLRVEHTQMGGKSEAVFRGAFRAPESKKTTRLIFHFVKARNKEKEK